jgi:hypothetical protein
MAMNIDENEVTITLPVVIAQKVVTEILEIFANAGVKEEEIVNLKNQPYEKGMDKEGEVALLKLTTALEKAVPHAFEGGRRQGKAKPKTRRNRKAKRPQAP